jgi:cytochrome c-type biogenesis protein CcmF
MGLLLVALMAIGPMLTYGEGSGKRLARGIAFPALLAIAIIAAAFFLGIHSAWALIAVAIVSAGIACIFADLTKTIIHRVRDGESPFAALINVLDSNHRRYGGQLTHIGMLLIIAGIVGSSVFGQKQELQLKPGQTIAFAGGKLTYVAMHENRQANYNAVQAEMTFASASGEVTTLRPQRRFYDKSEQPNTEVALDSNWKRDLYVTLGGWEDSGSAIAIEAIVNPLVSWIWTGGVVMAIGAIMCLLPRVIPQRDAAATEAKPARHVRLSPTM